MVFSLFGWTRLYYPDSRKNSDLLFDNFRRTFSDFFHGPDGVTYFYSSHFLIILNITSESGLIFLKITIFLISFFSLLLFLSEKYVKQSSEFSYLPITFDDNFFDVYNRSLLLKIFLLSKFLTILLLTMT